MTATQCTCSFNLGLLPPLTSTVKSSLFMHAHSSPLSSAARLHPCHINHSHYINSLFVLVIISFAVQSLFSLVQFVYFFVSLTPGDVSEKILLQEMSEILQSMFSFRVFPVSSFTVKSSIHFEFILYKM